jgi:hypothetical protein
LVMFTGSVTEPVTMNTEINGTPNAKSFDIEPSYWALFMR